MSGAAHITADRPNTVYLLANACGVSRSMVSVKILVVSIIDDTLGAHKVAGIAGFIDDLPQKLHVGEELIDSSALIFGKGVDDTVKVNADANT